MLLPEGFQRMEDEGFQVTNSTFPNSNFPSLPLAGFVPVTTYRYSPYHQNILSQATPNVTAQATAKSKAGTVAQ